MYICLLCIPTLLHIISLKKLKYNNTIFQLKMNAYFLLFIIFLL